jgi:hypothetical protein
MKYKNGTIWEAEWPLCWVAVLQVLPNNKYCLLGHGRALHGGNCLNAFVEEDGTWQYTEEELNKRLERWSQADATLVVR